MFFKGLGLKILPGFLPGLFFLNEVAMKKLKTFAAEQQEQLEHAVNQWLSENKNISILSSDLKVVPGNTAGYLFHILYTVTSVDEEGKLQTLAVVDQSSATADNPKVVEVITQSESTLKN
jgi:hypothetical protein